MTPRELAILYLEQLRAHEEGVPADRPEPNALFFWEELISSDPEQAWPVFEQVLMRASNDDTLEQVWYRLRLLLHRRYDAFHARAAELFARFPRFSLVAGPRALDADRYADKPFDRQALVDAYRAVHRTHEDSHQLEHLLHSDPERALHIAIEIVHRGVARGRESFDVMTPLQDVLDRGDERLLLQVEEIAKSSVAARRVLWRMRRHLRRVDEEQRARIRRAAGTTTDYTELDVVPPAPQPQLDADEKIVEAWLEHDSNFWAFSELNDLCDDDPKLAWSITLELIDAAVDEDETAYIAAGPLEDLIRKHPDVIWEDLTARAYADEAFRNALRGVWVFEDDGEVYDRFHDLMETVLAEPN